MASPAAAAAPLVTIIVRSIGRDSLREALHSIGRQDYPRIDVVIVAACGVDRHPPLPASIGPHPLRIVGGNERLSRPRAANAGLDAAAGDWITFLDDDDVLLATHVGGLVAMTDRAGDAKIVYTLARARFSDGSVRPVGQPFALHEIHQRNFIHLSMALFSRELLALGCRFDESLDVLQDWDFFIQCAQHTRFHFEPRQTFEWCADVGSAGTGAGANQDDARFAAFRDRIYAKWAPRYDALVDRVTAGLAHAADCAKRGALAPAEAACRDVLQFSQNDPFALNLLAMIQRTAGRIDDARETQSLACAVRPHDASLARNLALLDASPPAVAGAKAHAQA
jgi:glycosyltransferase involved in cell wall biosynthesis